MFNGVGGSTVHWEAHFPRFHPSDFRVRIAGRRGRRLADRLRGLSRTTTSTTAMIGVSGLAGDPANPPRASAPHAAARPRHARRSRGARLRQAGLALVAVGQRDPSRDYDGRLACDLRGTLQLRLPPGRQGLRRRHLLAQGARRRRALETWARVREITVDAEGRVARRRRTSTGMGRALGSSRARGRRLLQRHRHAAPAAELELAALPDGLANSQRARRAGTYGPPGRYVEGIFDEPMDGPHRPHRRPAS